MKKAGLLVFMLIPLMALAQETAKKSELSDLIAPASAAFMLVDIAPTLVQSPGTPKSFVLGVAQSLSNSTSAFPDNYSVSLTPYWWLKPQGQSVYKFLGLVEPKIGRRMQQNIFSGLKFTTLSAAFINKDLIPDEAETSQKAFSVGIGGTIIRVHSPAHIKKLYDALKQWHEDAQREIDDNALLVLDEIQRLKLDSTFNAKRRALIEQYQETKTPPAFSKLNNLINVKPVFAWDVAAAIAIYGLDNGSTATGRTGVWTTLSSYVPLGNGEAGVNKNYFDIHATMRYLRDNYQLNDAGLLERGNNVDFGGKAGFVFDHLSLGVEAIYRHNNGITNTGNRTVGTIGVRVAKNIYINGSFGKDFTGPKKLISIFGINWGFGKETVELP